MLSFILKDTYIKQGNIKLMKRGNKDIYKVRKTCISNKCCSFDLPIYQRTLKKMHQGFHKNIKQPKRFDKH